MYQRTGHSLSPFVLLDQGGPISLTRGHMTLASSLDCEDAEVIGSDINANDF